LSGKGDRAKASAGVNYMASAKEWSQSGMFEAAQMGLRNERQRLGLMDSVKSRKNGH
jgi:hypothetical protein